MKTKTSDALKASEKQTVNDRTINAYKELAACISKNAELAKDKEDKIREGWEQKRRTAKKKATYTSEQEETSEQEI